MHYSIYLRLIVLTAGTLLPFFWMVVILGHRRQRNFERIFFFLCLALVFLFGASLLALNAQLYYTTIPPPLAIFCWTAVCLGLWFLPSLLVHLHVEYAQIRELLRPGARKRLWLALAYVPAVALFPSLFAALRLRGGFDFVLPSNSLGWPFQAWLIVALVIAAGWQWRFAKAAPDGVQKGFHRSLRFDLAWVAAWILAVHFMLRHRLGGDSEQNAAVYSIIVVCFALAPLATLIRKVQKFNFLQIGRQRNLIYAVFATFLALLYLSLVRRASLWMEPYLPPEASAAILLFLPVVFFEPLQRLMRGILRRAAQSEMDLVQRLMAEIQQEARQGDLRELVKFIERRVREQFELATATLTLLNPGKSELRPHVSRPGEAMDRTPASIADQYFPVRQRHGSVAVLRAEPHGAAISGETRAALEFLCEQLPGALDLCRLIEEKLRLERELAERERLAVLGQMAASISHNLKNPLGSIKTILQVQMENPELPDSIRGETKMVLEEIGRLSSKLNQLLQFSRPAIRGGVLAATCDARTVAEEVSGVLRHEAERRGLALDVEVGAEGTKLAASAEAVSEILSNLVVNALEATPRGGHVKVSGRANGDGFLFSVEDDGPGVPESAREKLLQPFFTTKTQGTGLGLAIVARRVAEFGGRLDWQSPAKDDKGTRFEVTMPRKEEKK
ncbi:MAG: two-component system sensor histidine kinase NtrB [Candidatus Acidiferrales bacterium]